MRNKYKKMPNFKKDIKDFLLSEEGKIIKKNIIKIGVSLATLSMMFPAKSGFAYHENSFKSTGGTGGGGYHHSHGAHGSHGSHGSHTSVQW